MVIYMADRLFRPIAAGAPRPLRFEFDGAEITARPHDTVLAAVLAAQASCGAVFCSLPLSSNSEASLPRLVRLEEPPASSTANCLLPI